VKENHAVQVVVLDHCPASPVRRAHLVVAVPGPFDGWHAVPRGQAAVDLAVDVGKVKVAMPFVIELEAPFFFLVDDLLVPLFHLNDSLSRAQAPVPAIEPAIPAN
jgi:hypothetical protein